MQTCRHIAKLTICHRIGANCHTLQCHPGVGTAFVQWIGVPPFGTHYYYIATRELLYSDKNKKKK